MSETGSLPCVHVVGEGSVGWDGICAWPMVLVAGKWQSFGGYLQDELLFPYFPYPFVPRTSLTLCLDHFLPYFPYPFVPLIPQNSVHNTCAHAAYH